MKREPEVVYLRPNRVIELHQVNFSDLEMRLVAESDLKLVYFGKSRG